ncbi:hypothetical protein [Aphanizomenon flos-aquae]|uniref:hypothetical protein n=1 Tax=Aphanizomenon flos-aquae TaxID=1176 RepID=UPI0004B02FB3|nr:hypothetical protein [Aphanizomenon flos-aquae]
MLNHIIQKVKRIINLPNQIQSLETRLNDLETKASSQEIQALLKLKFQEYHISPPEKLPLFDQVGFKAYSQFEEDGILLYIFSLIGTTNKKVVEICAGHGKECMAANLIINHGWQGYLFDGSEQNVKSAQNFFANHKQTFLMPPTVNHAWFTAENVNQILSDAGVSGEIDLLSLDIDGMDYWVWKAIKVIQPRVCLFETHNVIPSHLSLTAKYDPNFYYLNQPTVYSKWLDCLILKVGVKHELTPYTSRVFVILPKFISHPCLVYISLDVLKVPHSVSNIFRYL